MKGSFRGGAAFRFVLAITLSAGPGLLCAQTNGVRGVTDTTGPTSRTGQAGGYYALIIGINAYQFQPQLMTPKKDATEIAAVLGDQFGFKTELLLDATRDQIMGALERYRRNLKEADSLVIYYAGHGYMDRSANIAYLAPVDAGQESYARWIIAPEINANAKANPARHVLVIADSCFSGMIATKSAVGPDADGGGGDAGNTAYVAKMMQARSRTLFASGGDEPVADGDAPGHFSEHSVFANVLLQSLSQFQATDFTAEQLYMRVFGDVQQRHAIQKPEYDLIPDEGVPHSRGDFVFHRVKQGSIGNADETIHITQREPVRSTNLEEEKIRAALDLYEDAYASMDVRELKKAWPTLSKDQERELKGSFQAPGLNAVKVQLRNRTMRVAGDRATADCDQWLVYTYSGRRQPPQTNALEILLAKDSRGNWAINGVKGK